MYILYIIYTYVYLYTINTLKIIVTEAGRGAAARGVTAKPTVVCSIPTRGDEIFT